VFCLKDVYEGSFYPAWSDFAGADSDFAAFADAVDFDLPAHFEATVPDFEPVVADDSDSAAAFEVDFDLYLVDEPFAAVVLHSDLAAEPAVVDFDSAVEFVAADSEPDFVRIPPLNKSVLQLDRWYIMVSF